MVPWLLCALLGGWGLYLLGRLYCLHRARCRQYSLPSRYSPHPPSRAHSSQGTIRLPPLSQILPPEFSQAEGRGQAHQKQGGPRCV